MLKPPLRSDAKALYEQLSRDAMLRQNDPIDTLHKALLDAFMLGIKQGQTKGPLP
jgi:hypothetical protein